MQSIDLSQVKVLLVDSQVHSRRLMRDALYMAGFRKIENVRQFAHMASMIEQISPDLILVDADEDRPHVCDAIRGIRNRELGHNPFAIVVALTWSPEQGAVDTLLGAGTDDIVAKPLSPKLLHDRVVNLIYNRKDFVVTPDYVGPDRGQHTRRDSEDELPLLKVPNQLRQAALREGECQQEGETGNSVRSLCMQQIYRLAGEISESARKLKAGRAPKGEGAAVNGALTRMADMLKQIDSLAAEQRFQGIPEISSSIRQILDRIAAAGGCAQARQFELLELHGQAIMITLRESDESVGVLVSALSEAKMAVNA